MPLYELECNLCSHRQTTIAKYSDLPQIKCEVCQGETRLVPSTMSFDIKGYSEKNGYGTKGERK